MLRFSQYGGGKSESKNWEDQKMKSGKADSVLKSWNKTSQLGTYIALFDNFLPSYHEHNFQSQLKWTILEMNCQIKVAIVM